MLQSYICKYVDRVLKTRVAVAVLGLALFAFGVRLDLNLGVVGRAFGTFVALTGLQIFMWSVGIRLELFGTASDVDLMSSEIPVTNRPMLLEPSKANSEFEKHLAEEETELARRRQMTTAKLERMRMEIQEEELHTKLQMIRKEQLLVDMEIAELQAKITDFEKQRSETR
jgi:hypothetical protein